MKALLFTLFLFFAVISPSLAAPPTPPSPPPPDDPSDPINRRYIGRQRIFYNVFTNVGVFNIELLYSPSVIDLVEDNYGNTRIIQPRSTPKGGRKGKTTQVIIEEREVQRWVFNRNPPESMVNFISAELEFIRPGGQQKGTPIPAGVTIIENQRVRLNQLTFNTGYVDGRYQRVGEPRTHPLRVTAVFMTVLEPNALRLDQRTQQRIQQQGMQGYLRDTVGSSSSQPAPTPPLDLDAGIWIHLLANRMADYRAGEIECEPAPDPRPNPDDACRQPGTRPRGPGDQDDPEGQPESKRPCTGPDGEYLPDPDDQSGDQGGAGQAADIGGTSHQAVIFDYPDPHVELQTTRHDGLPINPFWFPIPHMLIYLFADKVRDHSPKTYSWMSCHETFKGSGHDGGL
jgi:hypothetical protein